MDASDFQVPSFSLGLEFDSHCPSFSLGFEDETQTLNPNQGIRVDRSDAQPHRPDFSSEPLAFEDPDNENEILQGSFNEDPLPTLKRLKRGPPVHYNSTPQANTPSFEVDKTLLECDDIEDCSSSDDSSKEHHKTLQTPGVRPRTSAKLSLHGLKVLGAPTQNSDCTTSSSIFGETSGKKETTAGERLRQLQEIRRLNFKFSDEEDDDIVVGISSAAWKSKDNNSVKSVFTCQNIGESGKNVSYETSQKCFNGIQNSNLPSAAFDEFCDEYFRSAKTTSDGIYVERDHSVDNSAPQAFQYFDSEDMRIQKLVRQRLCNFLPINAVMRGEGQGAEPVEIDYLGQFGGSQHASAVSGVNLQSRCSKKSQKKSASRSSGKGKRPIKHDNGNCNWTAKRSRTLEPGVPRDAGKRRVTASGRWYTDQSGRKIYVTKDGEELTGRVAFRSYRKDNGKPLRKSKKKFKKHVTKKK